MIPNGFSIHAAEACTGEKTVGGIFGDKFRSGLTPKPESSTGEQVADVVFEIEPGADESGGEVVQQLGVGGRLAGVTEVVGGGDESLSEHMMPEPVGDDSSEQRIVGAGQFPREFKATGDLLEGKWSPTEGFEKGARNGFTGLMVIASWEQRLVEAGGLDHAGSGALRCGAHAVFDCAKGLQRLPRRHIERGGVAGDQSGGETIRQKQSVFVAKSRRFPAVQDFGERLVIAVGEFLGVGGGRGIQGEERGERKLPGLDGALGDFSRQTSETLNQEPRVAAPTGR